MKLFSTNKTMDRMHQMIDNAIDGKPVENSFDESKISAMESKLNQFLKITQNSQQQIEEEKLQINSLISNISHQTRTPIANMMLYSQLLEEQEMSDECRKYTHELVRQAEKLDFLVDSLLKSSRLEHGIITVHPEYTDVHKLIQDAVEQIREKANLKNIQISYEKSKDIALFDLRWTIEAVYNILDNAVKYTKEGGKIEISVLKLDLFCRMDIKDTGVGIPEEEICKVFSRFYRGATSIKEEGIGIGLFLSREIISKQGGYIKLSSKPDKGSCFSVFLPLRD